MDTNVKRGEIYYADLSPVVGSEQGGVRPVLIVQNDTGNRHSPTVIAAAITSQMGKAKLPTHIEVAAQCCGLPKDSVILLEQIRTLDKRRLRERMGRVDGAVMRAGGRRHCGELRPAPQQIGIAARRRVHNLPRSRKIPRRTLRPPGSFFIQNGRSPFWIKGLQSAARIICSLKANKFHTCRLRRIFVQVHAPDKNDCI